MINDRRGEEVLRCPRCADRLEAIYLDDEEEDGSKCQRIGWACRGLRTDSCDFPLDMPPEVFWTKRTLQQRSEDFTPLPNFHLLPRRYRHLYPTLFPQNAPKRRSRTKDKRRTAGPNSPALSSISSVENQPIEVDEERRNSHDRSLSPGTGSNASGSAVMSRTASRMSLHSEASSGRSKPLSVEERLPTPEREQFRALCIPAAPLVPRHDVSTTSPPTQKSPKKAAASVDPAKPTTSAACQEEAAAVANFLEGLSDDQRTVTEETITDEDCELLENLSKPGAPSVPHVIPNSPNATLPIAVAPHSQQSSKCLETVSRETTVTFPNRNQQRSERHHMIKSAIEKRAKRIPETSSSKLQVVDLDNVQIRDEAGKKKIDIFHDSNATLKSLIYMRYKPDDFLHALQRTMTKEGMVAPFTAMTPQQRKMTAQLADSLREQSFSSSKAKGPNWLARTNLSASRDRKDVLVDTSDSESIVDGPPEKRPRIDLFPTGSTPRVTEYLPRKARMKVRPSPGALKEQMLSKLESRMKEDVSSRTGLRGNKLSQKKAPVMGATPPRVCSSPTSSEDAAAAPLASVSGSILEPPVANTESEEPSTLSTTQSDSTYDQEHHHDDLSDIPSNLRMNMFDDPELNALVNRKLRKIVHENVIYDQKANAFYVPAHVQAVPGPVLQQVDPSAPPLQPQPHPFGQAQNDLDYFPNGLLANPDGNLNEQWDFNVMNPASMENPYPGQIIGDPMQQDGGNNWGDYGLGALAVDDQDGFMEYGQSLPLPDQDDSSWHLGMGGSF